MFFPKTCYNYFIEAAVRKLFSSTCAKLINKLHAIVLFCYLFFVKIKIIQWQKIP